MTDKVTTDVTGLTAHTSRDFIPAGSPMAADPTKPNDVVVVEPPKRHTLADIMSLFQQVDDGLLTMDLDDMKALDITKGEKVDGYRNLIDMLRSEAARLSVTIEPIQQKIKSLESRAKQVEASIKFHTASEAVIADSDGHKRLKGLRWVAKLIHRKNGGPLVTKEGKNPDSLLNAYGYRRYLDSMKRGYVWDKNAIKKILKSDKQDLANEKKDLAEMFELSDSMAFSWEPNTEI